MATTPAGWTQRTINPQEYEATLDLGNFEKYEVNVNVQTGQRQIYTVTPLIGNKNLLATVNADGTVTKTNVYNNVAAQPNGQTRIKNILDASRTAANKIVGSVGTEQQKTSLANQKEYGKLKSGLQGSTTPPTPGGGSQDTGGPNSGGENAAAGTAADGGVPPVSITEGFVNVTSFNKDDGSYPSILRYPSTIENGQDYLMIKMYNYLPNDVVFKSGSVDFQSILGGASLSNSSTKTESTGYVLLPIPANISESNETGWGSSELNNLAAGLMGTASGVVGSVSGGDVIGGISDVTAAAKQVFGGANDGAKNQIKQQLTLGAAASLVKKLGINVDAEAYRARATGTVINPNLELLFNGPKLRNFSFEFKMTPRSAPEASQIRQIIKFFKKGMAPKRATSGDDGFFLGAPNVFEIKFMHKGKSSKGLPTLKTCALVNFSVNYTADGFYSAFNDGQPISVSMNMSFAELSPIYNDNYDFGDDNVGFKSENLSDLEQPRFEVSRNEPAANDRPNRPAEPSRGGASDPVAPATRVFQQGGPTATPGVDTPPPFSGRPGTEPTFTGGVRGI